MATTTTTTKRRSNRQQVTITDIAERCGVSRITVSYALRGQRSFVSQQRIDQVKKVAKEMGYDRSMAMVARRLRAQANGERVINHLVGMYFPFTDFSHPYWTELFSSLQLTFQCAGYALVCFSDETKPNEQSQDQKKLPELIRRGDVDGVVIFPTETQRQGLIQHLRQESGYGQRPVVSLLESFKNSSSVVFDDMQVGQLAAGHLLDIGHRHLMAFRSERYTSSIIAQRFAGYEKAFRDRGLDPAAGLHIVPFIWDHAGRMMTDFHSARQQYPQVTGVLCPNDGMGIKLAAELRRENWQIPGDLSFIGIDDCETLSDAKGVNIWTTVRLPLKDLAQAAARLLIDQIEQPENSQRVIKVLPPELVVRDSTSKPSIS